MLASLVVYILLQGSATPHGCVSIGVGRKINMTRYGYNLRMMLLLVWNEECMIPIVMLSRWNLLQIN